MEKEYVILNIEKEYPGYTGSEKWMIITDLFEDQFAELYPDQYPCWKDAVIMNSEMGKEIIRYHNNDRKHEIRNANVFPLERIGGVHDKKITRTDVIKNPVLKAALKNVTETQARRIIGVYVEGMTQQEVADIEECSVPAVCRSIKRGLKQMNKYMVSTAAKKVEA